MGDGCVFCGAGTADDTTTTMTTCCGASCHYGCMRSAVLAVAAASTTTTINCCCRSQAPVNLAAAFCQYSERLSLPQCIADARRIDRGLAEAEDRYYGDGIVSPATMSDEHAIDMMGRAQAERALLGYAVHCIRLLKLRSCSKRRRRAATPAAGGEENRTAAA